MGIFSKIKNIFISKKLDSKVLEDLADALITADVSPNITDEIIKQMRAKFRPDDETNESEIKNALAEILWPYVEKLSNNKSSATKNLSKPHVFLIIGVNGAGKTTTIGKIADKFVAGGQTVVIGACDTFRAAAFDQLNSWTERAGAKIICSDKDPAANAFKTIENAISENADIVILDTAGRLHNRTDLMDELAKMVRVIKKIIPDAPHETLLVLDSNTGQNAINQIDFFNAVAPLTGLIVTKMDATSRGGFLISYAGREKSPLPVYAVGNGEKISDLQDFNPTEYLNKLLDL